VNRRNQGKSEKSEYIYKKRKKVRGADEVLKRALADCMQEETNQVQKKLEREGQHAFSKPFIENRRKNSRKRKHVGGDGPVWQPHALYVWLWQAEAGSGCVEI